METDLTKRLHAYATTAEAAHHSDTSLYADALASSAAASASASASLISSHTRVLRGDSPPRYLAEQLFPEQDELDVLIARKPEAKPGDLPTSEEPASEAPSHRPLLPLRPGNACITNIALGAAGIAAIKNA